MPRKFSAYLLAIAASVSVSSAVSMAASRPACADTLSVDTVLAREADAFLRSLSEGLQKRQEEAVRRAMAGDDAALEAVRASRNAPPMIPADVVATDISEIYRLYRPASSGNARLPVLIYLHGGGWCFGSINSCARFCAELSRRAGVAVLAVDYPLAPRYPFPHALDASLEAVGFALANAGTYGFDTGRISLGGDSAGGNLALSAALAIVSGRPVGDSRLPVDALRSIVLFYPVVKAWSDGSESWKTDYGSFQRGIRRRCRRSRSVPVAILRRLRNACAAPAGDDGQRRPRHTPRSGCRHGLSASEGGRGGLPQHPALRRTSVHHRSRPAACL